MITRYRTKQRFCFLASSTIGDKKVTGKYDRLDIGTANCMEVINKSLIVIKYPSNRFLYGTHAYNPHIQHQFDNDRTKPHQNKNYFFGKKHF